MDAEGVLKLCDALDLRHSAVYTPPGRNPHMQISCPLACDPKRHRGSDERPSCSVMLDDDGPSVARCHGANCGFRGSLVALVTLAVRLRQVGRMKGEKSLSELIRWVKQSEKLDPETLLRRSDARVREAPKVFSQVQRAKDVIDEARLSRMSTELHPYAVGRGITLESWQRWGLRYDPAQQCVVFPVRNTKQSLVGLAGRDVTGENTKAHNYPGLRSAHYLFGEHLLRVGKPVVIVEGQVDAVKTDAVLGDRCSTVAVMGGGFSDRQGRTIRGFHPPVVYVFTDGDAGGDTLARKITRVLSPFVVIKRLQAERGSDPGAMTGAAIEAAFSASSAC